MILYYTRVSQRKAVYRKCICRLVGCLSHVDLLMPRLESGAALLKSLAHTRTCRMGKHACVVKSLWDEGIFSIKSDWFSVGSNLKIHSKYQFPGA